MIDKFAGAGNRDQVAIAMLDGLEVVELDRTRCLYMDVVNGGGTRCGTTDMEGTHGQLGAGLTDRLRSDDTDCLADIDDVSTCQVATVTEAAYTERGRTGDW